jgi:hypothetical protein
MLVITIVSERGTDRERNEVSSDWHSDTDGRALQMLYKWSTAFVAVSGGYLNVETNVSVDIPSTHRQRTAQSGL